MSHLTPIIKEESGKPIPIIYALVIGVITFIFIGTLKIKAVKN